VAANDFILNLGVKFSPKDVDTKAIKLAIAKAAAASKVVISKASLSKTAQEGIKKSLAGASISLSNVKIDTKGKATIQAAFGKMALRLNNVQLSRAGASKMQAQVKAMPFFIGNIRINAAAQRQLQAQLGTLRVSAQPASRQAANAAARPGGGSGGGTGPLNEQDTASRVQQIKNNNKVLAQYARTATGAEKAEVALNRVVANSGRSWQLAGARIGAVVKRFGEYTIAASLVLNLTKGFRSAAQGLTEFDNALQDLSKIAAVTDKIDQAGRGLTNVALSTGKSVTDVSTALNDFARQGLGLQDALNKTEQSLRLTNISQLSAADSAKIVTASYKVFGLTNESLSESLDKLSVFADKSATNVTEIGKAFLRSASSAASAGLEIDQFQAILAATLEATRLNSSQIGTAFKTILARIQRDAPKLRKLANGFLDLNDALRLNASDTVFETFQKVAGIFPKLNGQQKNMISLQIAGVRQANIISAAFSNFGKVNELLDPQLQTTGKALEKNAEQLQKLSVRSQNFQTSIKALAAEVVGFNKGADERGFGATAIVGAVDAATDFVNIIRDVNKGFDSLVAGAGAFGKVFNIAAIAAFFTVTNVAIRKVVAGTKLFLGSAQQAAGVVGQLNTQLSGTVNAERLVTNELRTQNALRKGGLAIGGAGAGKAATGGVGKAGSALKAGGSALAVFGLLEVLGSQSQKLTARIEETTEEVGELGAVSATASDQTKLLLANFTKTALIAGFVGKSLLGLSTKATALGAGLIAAVSFAAAAREQAKKASELSQAQTDVSNLLQDSARSAEAVASALASVSQDVLKTNIGANIEALGAKTAGSLDANIQKLFGDIGLNDRNLGNLSAKFETLTRTISKTTDSLQNAFDFESTVKSAASTRQEALATEKLITEGITRDTAGLLAKVNTIGEEFSFTIAGAGESFLADTLRAVQAAEQGGSFDGAIASEGFERISAEIDKQTEAAENLNRQYRIFDAAVKVAGGSLDVLLGDLEAQGTAAAQTVKELVLQKGTQKALNDLTEDHKKTNSELANLYQVREKISAVEVSQAKKLLTAGKEYLVVLNGTAQKISKSVSDERKKRETILAEARIQQVVNKLAADGQASRAKEVEALLRGRLEGEKTLKIAQQRVQALREAVELTKGAQQIELQSTLEGAEVELSNLKAELEEGALFNVAVQIRKASLEQFEATKSKLDTIIEDSVAKVTGSEKDLAEARKEVQKLNQKLISDQRALSSARSAELDANSNVISAMRTAADAQYNLAISTNRAKRRVLEQVGAVSTFSEKIASISSDLNIKLIGSEKEVLKVRSEAAGEMLNIFQQQFSSIQSLGKSAATAGVQSVADISRGLGVAQSIAGGADVGSFNADQLKSALQFESLFPEIGKAVADFGLAQLGVDPAVMESIEDKMLTLAEITAEQGKANVSTAQDQLAAARVQAEESVKATKAAAQQLETTKAQKNVALQSFAVTRSHLNLATRDLAEQRDQASRRLGALGKVIEVNEKNQTTQHDQLKSINATVDELKRLNGIMGSFANARAAAFSATNIDNNAHGSLSSGELNGLALAAKREKSQMPAGSKLMLANTSEVVLNRRQAGRLGMTPRRQANAANGNGNAEGMIAAVGGLRNEVRALRSDISTGGVKNVSVQVDTNKSVNVKGIQGLGAELERSLAGKFASNQDQEAIRSALMDIVNKLGEDGFLDSLGR